MAEYTWTNSAKRGPRQQLHHERQHRPEGQTWQIWAQTLPPQTTQGGKTDDISYLRPIRV